MCKIRLESEIRQFCLEKYGTKFPSHTEFGYVIWMCIPLFEKPFAPKGLWYCPYVSSEEKEMVLKDRWKKEDEEIAQWEKLTRAEKRQWFTDSRANNGAEMAERFKKDADEYRAIEAKYGVNRQLTPEELALVGIEFDAYKLERKEKNKPDETR